MHLRIYKNFDTNIVKAYKTDTVNAHITTVSKSLINANFSIKSTNFLFIPMELY